ncbi:MAG TPA: hypothetical protein VE153_22495 [Myxococcus sp.]|nr:hypothetical protein [Myxococcus sp.]
MTKRVVISAMCCALWVLSTGCGDECQDASDCRNDNGQPAEGQQWACNEGTCTQRPVEQPEQDAGTDAGTTDAGTDAGVDAGTDAGVDAGTDAGVDAGTDAGADAGSMTVAEGGACISSGDCQPGLRCEGTPDKTCRELHVAVTGQVARQGGPRPIKALVVRHDTPAYTELTAANTDSRYPRWNRDGSAVAFVQGAVDTQAERTAGELVVRTLPLATGTSTVVADGGTGNTESFRFMEWEPGPQILYVRRNGASTSGISVVPTDGGTVAQFSQSGTFPDWSADGTTFAYSIATQGLLTASVGGAPTPLANSGETAEQPHFNRANNQLLFLRQDASRPADFNTSLFVIPITGGTVQPIADFTTEAVTGGSIDSYIANPNWAPDGSWVAYVRAYYSRPTAGSPVLCGSAEATLCPTRPGNVIFLQRINAPDGSASGEPIEFVSGGTLPSFSPDAHHLAYIQGGALRVWRLDPATGNKVGTDPRIHPATDFTLLTGEGDDHRPRWQPK